MNNGKFTLNVGLALDLKRAFVRNGWTAKEVKALTAGDFLKGVRAVLRGAAEIRPIGCIVDCDAAPYVPKGRKVEEHRKGGVVDLAKTKIVPHLVEAQKTGRIVGCELYKLLADQPVLNANVLDFLLAHPHLIPEEWKGKAVFFWGTIYRNGNGDLVVRYLYWSGVLWGWSDDWLDHDWLSSHPAACGQASA